MKKLKLLLLGLAVSILAPAVALAVQITVPSAPGYGYVLIGQPSGNYTPVATSTLGITGSGGSSFGYPFPSNSTTTILSFTNGLTLSNFTGLIGANLGSLYAISTSSLNASITGNAGTATVLQTPRTINGVSFNGSANIVVASTSLLGDTNTFSGNDTFNNTITGSITGNSGTATKLTTGRTIAITGDLSYTSPTFDGSGNVTAAGTLATVNGNVGTFTYPSVTVNAKGLITAISNGSAPTTYTGAFPISVSGSSISFLGLATSSPWTQGQLAFVVNGNTIESTATTTASCSGTVSCTPFVILGSSPVTLTGSGGGGTGLATSSPTANNQVLVYNSAGAGSAYSVATTTITANNGLSGAFTALNTGGNSNTVGLATINAGVLGAVTNGVVPTSQATSTLYGVGTGGQVLGWNNNTNSLTFVATSTGGGSGTVTSVGLSMPTGITVTNSPVTNSGTLTAALQTGFSFKEIPSWTVCSLGCDFTTIQAALNAAGTAGGGTIYLTDAVYNDGSTALLIKSSNTTITSNASTTINFTGATTLFKTNAAASQFTNITIQHLVITGDNTTGGVAINTSDMSHSNYSNNTITSVDQCFVANDTQNITFYNRIADNNCTFKSIGLNASSTNAWNANIVDGNFFGGQTANAIGIQMTNANGDAVTNNRIETAAVNATIDIFLFDNNIASCNGIFNNTISGNYLESGKATNSTTGVRFGASLCASTKIYNNQLSENISENHQFDYIFAATTTEISLQNWFGNIDGNFGNSLNSFSNSLGISTSSELQNIGNTQMPALAISASSTVNSNDLLIEHTGNGGTDNTDFQIDTSGNIFLPNLKSQSCLGTSATGQLQAGTCSGGGGGIGDPFTHAFSTLSATTSEMAIGTSTVSGRTQLTLSTTTTTTGTGQLAIAAGAGAAQWQFRDTPSGELYLGPTNTQGTATTTSSVLNLTAGGKIGIGGENNSAANITIGPTDSDTLINSAFGFVATNPGGDARVGAASGNFLTGITTGDGSTYGALYAFNYNTSVAENLVLGQFGGNVEAGASTTPFAQLSVQSNSTTLPLFAVATTTTKTIFEIDANGHFIVGGPTPTVSGGTSTIVAKSTDASGQINVAGTALTSVTLTFAKSWVTAPNCTESDSSTAVTGDISSISTTQIVFNFSAGVTTVQLWYNCTGNQ